MKYRSKKCIEVLGFLETGVFGSKLDLIAV